MSSSVRIRSVQSVTIMLHDLLAPPLMLISRWKPASRSCSFLIGQRSELNMLNLWVIFSAARSHPSSATFPR